MLRGMGIIQTTRGYERWLGAQTSIVRRDLVAKHAAMAEGSFTLLRATFYAWMDHWEKLAIDELRGAPQVRAVGDLHVENFGTWRDAEGRLIWGINDFDEAAIMPYPLDLVRLAASVRMSPKLRVADRVTADAILITGYREGLVEPKPTLLTERETW